jgi:hypothetical protein
MREQAGAALELVGLTLVGLGLLHGLATGDVKRELLMLLIGAGVFVVGWMMAARKGLWRS